MMLYQSLLGKAPESLDAIDVDLSQFELISVIDVQVLVPAER
jgi:hypothetical protein